MHKSFIFTLSIAIFFGLSGCMSEPWQAGWQQFKGSELQGANLSLNQATASAFQAGAGL